MALLVEKHIFNIESIMVKNAEVMMVRKPNRFMILPAYLKPKLKEKGFAQNILSDMDRSADLCRKQFTNSDLSLDVLKEVTNIPVDGVDILTNIDRVAIRRNGKTISIAKYYNAGWDAKIYPRYGLEDGVFTSNIGKIELPNVFEHVILGALNAKDNTEEWKEFITLCFDQYTLMISTKDG